MKFKEKLYNFLKDNENKSAILFFIDIFMFFIIANVFKNVFLIVLVYLITCWILGKLYCKILDRIFLGKSVLMKARKRPVFRRKTSEQSTKNSSRRFT